MRILCDPMPMVGRHFRKTRDLRDRVNHSFDRSVHGGYINIHPRVAYIYRTKRPSPSCTEIANDALGQEEKSLFTRPQNIYIEQKNIICVFCKMNFLSLAKPNGCCEKLDIKSNRIISWLVFWAFDRSHGALSRRCQGSAMRIAISARINLRWPVNPLDVNKRAFRLVPNVPPNQRQCRVFNQLGCKMIRELEFQFRFKAPICRVCQFKLPEYLPRK